MNEAYTALCHGRLNGVSLQSTTVNDFESFAKPLLRQLFSHALKLSRHLHAVVDEVHARKFDASSRPNFGRTLRGCSSINNSMAILPVIS